MAYWDEEFQRLRSPILRYGFAVVLVAIALAIAWVLQAYRFRDVGLPILALVIGVVTWYAGNGPAVLSVLLSTAAFDYLFVEPIYSFYVYAQELPYFLVFVLSAVIVSSYSTVRRRIEDNLRHARDRLQTELEQRQQREDEIRNLNRELTLRAAELAVIEAIPAIAFTTQPDGSSVWINRRWVEFSGLSVEETSGSGWQSAIHPDDLVEHVAKWHQSVASGEPFENEARHRSAEGEYRWFLVRAVPLRDEHGKILKWYGILTDIEDRKCAEQERERLRQLEADLAHVNRLNTLGELAASLTHEIKQPITAGIMGANACRLWLRADPPNISEACAAAETVSISFVGEAQPTAIPLKHIRYKTTMTTLCLRAIQDISTLSRRNSESR